MSASVNRVTVIGNLGRDPEVHHTQQGRTVVTFPLATHERWVDADGAMHQQTQWHNVVVWGKHAAACGTYLTKGRQVYVEGALCSRQSDTLTGEPRWIVEILARQVQFLGGGKPDSQTRVSEVDDGLEFLAEDEFG